MNIHPIRRRAIVRNLDDGYSIESIARTLEIDRDTVAAIDRERRRARELGREYPPPAAYVRGGETAAAQKAAREMLRKGFKAEVIYANFQGLLTREECGL